MTRKWFTHADFWVLLSVLAVILSLFLLLKPREEGDIVSVYVGNVLTAEFSFSDAPESYTVTTERGSLTLAFDEGGVSVLHADCPDHVCVRTGKIGRLGESIVCAPLGVCVTVEGGTLDGVTG